MKRLKMKGQMFFILALIPACMIFDSVKAEENFYGYVQNYSVFRSRSPYDVMLLRDRFRLNTEIQSGQVRGWASLDANSEMQSGGLSEISLREAYLDLYFSHLDLRIGKQQVVWGKADGLFINDLVNPLDLRMFILQDFEDIRMGVDMLKADFWLGDYSLEIVTIPKFVPMRFAERSSDWAFPLPDSLNFGIPTQLVLRIDTPDGAIYQNMNLVDYGYPVNLPVSYSSRSYPENLRNAEFGFKLNGFTFGFDWALMYLNVREDQPVFFKSADSTLTLPLEGMEIPVSLNFTETHPWLKIYGANFSTSLGSFVFRGEGGYFKGKRFDYMPEISLQDTISLVDAVNMANTFHEIEATGLLKEKDYLQYMLGFDYSLTGSIDLSMQFIQQHIFDYDPMLTADEDVYIATALLRGRYVNDTVLPVFLLMYNFTSESSLARFWVDWNAADAFTLTLGSDIIDGKENDFFGTFRKNDNFYVKVKYSF